MSMTSHDHYRDAIDEMHEDCCNTCGNLGYTIEINDEGVEYTESCFECFVEAHEADNAAKMLNEFEPGSPEYIHYEEIAA